MALTLHLQMFVSLVQTQLLAGLLFCLLLSVDPRASPHSQPRLIKLFVDSEVNKGHPSLNAASSKRTEERDDSNLSLV